MPCPLRYVGGALLALLMGAKVLQVFFFKKCPKNIEGKKPAAEEKAKVEKGDRSVKKKVEGSEEVDEHQRETSHSPPNQSMEIKKKRASQSNSSNTVAPSAKKSTKKSVNKSTSS